MEKGVPVQPAWTGTRVPKLQLRYQDLSLMLLATNNAWDLYISMADYLNKYMNIHTPDKDIKENILKENPVQKIKRHCPENKKTLSRK